MLKPSTWLALIAIVALVIGMLSSTILPNFLLAHASLIFCFGCCIVGSVLLREGH